MKAILLSSLLAIQPTTYSVSDQLNREGHVMRVAVYPFDTIADLRDFLRTRRPGHDYSKTHGAAYYAENGVCHILVVRPKLAGSPAQFDGLWVLGHELAHCLYGAWEGH